MPVGKENSSTAQAKESGCEKESSEEKGGQEKINIIECPITSKLISQCPLYDCMWSDKKGGCFHDECGAVPEVLGAMKGYSETQVASVIRKGKSEINRFLILDKYIDYVKEANAEFIREKPQRVYRINTDPQIHSLLQTGKIFHILKDQFRVDNFIMSQLCDAKLYAEYSKTLGIKPPNLVALIGIREIYQTDILKRAKRLRKPKRGKKVPSSKKTKSKSRANKCTNKSKRK